MRLKILLGFLLCYGSWALASDTLEIGYTEAPPFIFTENGRLQGIDLWLWEELAEENQWVYRIHRMPFDSLLLKLERREIDLSLNPLTLTSDRIAKFDFTQPFIASHSAIAVVEYSSLEKFLNLVGSFLDANFLRGLFILLGIISLFGILGWYFERKSNPNQFRKGWRGFWDGLWWSAVTLTTVGYGDKAPVTRWGKVAALALMFGGMLFISGLTASIASSLTVDQLSGSPEDLDHFKSRPVGVVQNTSTETFLQDRLFRNITSYPEVDAGLTALRSGEVEAFLHDEPILKYRKRHSEAGEEILILPYKFDPQFYGFGMAKGRDSLRIRLSAGILKARESRAWQVLLNEYGLSDY